MKTARNAFVNRVSSVGADNRPPARKNILLNNPLKSKVCFKFTSVTFYNKTMRQFVSTNV